MTLRILASLLLLISILYFPFWLSVILGLAGLIYFPFFFEAVVLFLLSDLLYGVGEARFLNIPFVAFILSALALFLIEFLKKKMVIRA